jgi:hypothetical protein
MTKIHPNFKTKMDPRQEGPYEVVRKRQNGSYVLKDATGALMERNYTASQLVPCPGNNFDEANTYDVETILDHRQDPTTNKYSYKVKWKNYDESHNTWEPTEHFMSDLCIRDYWNRIKQTPNKGSRKRKDKETAGTSKNLPKRRNRNR